MRTLSFGAALAALLVSVSPVHAQDSQPTSRPAPRPKFPALGHPAGVYGKGVVLDAAISLKDAAKKVEALSGKELRIDTPIKDVCKKKGCWMVIAEGDTQVRVRFENYSFFVPRDAHGREAITQGVLSQTTISEEMARHYAQESGKPEEAKKIHGPQKVLAFMATGVEILGRRELPPVAEATKPAIEASLARRLGAAKKVGAVAERASTLAQALTALRSVKGPRSVEFSLCTESGGWLVFSREGGRPFADGFAVKKGTGDVYSY